MDFIASRFPAKDLVYSIIVAMLSSLDIPVMYRGMDLIPAEQYTTNTGVLKSIFKLHNRLASMESRIAIYSYWDKRVKLETLLPLCPSSPLLDYLMSFPDLVPSANILRVLSRCCDPFVEGSIQTMVLMRLLEIGGPRSLLEFTYLMEAAGIQLFTSRTSLYVIVYAAIMANEWERARLFISYGIEGRVPMHRNLVGLMRVLGTDKPMFPNILPDAMTINDAVLRMKLANEMDELVLRQFRDDCHARNVMDIGQLRTLLHQYHPSDVFNDSMYDGHMDRFLPWINVPAVVVHAGHVAIEGIRQETPGLLITGRS